MDKISVVLRLYSNSIIAAITTRDLRSTEWKKMGWIADKKFFCVHVDAVHLQHLKKCLKSESAYAIKYLLLRNSQNEDTSKTSKAL